MSRVTCVRTGDALDLPDYPISPAIRVGDRVETAGILPIDPVTGELASADVTTQTRLALDNLVRVLEAAGSSWDDVLLLDVVLADADRDFAAFAATYGDWVGSHHPARRTIGAVLALPGLLIEVRASAVATKESA